MREILLFILCRGAGTRLWPLSRERDPVKLLGTMFSQWPNWLSRSPFVRRPVIKLWRMLLRAQRATFADAVLVIRRHDDRILVLPSPSGELRLPNKQLDAWVPITTQVEEWLEQLLPQTSMPSLVSVDGTPGTEGITFLYTAKTEAVSARRGEDFWLEPRVAASGLSSKDSKLLLLCTNAAP